MPNKLHHYIKYDMQTCKWIFQCIVVVRSCREELLWAYPKYGTHVPSPPSEKGPSLKNDMIRNIVKMLNIVAVELESFERLQRIFHVTLFAYIALMTIYNTCIYHILFLEFKCSCFASIFVPQLEFCKLINSK